MASEKLNSPQIDQFLQKLLSLSYNQKCADCGKPKPIWAALTFSFFVCYECSALHRRLGVLVSKVKNTSMDVWSVEDVRRMYVSGNKNAYKIPPNSDFSLKYKDTGEFVEFIDNLAEKSKIEEPGDSFMNKESERKNLGFGKNVIKKKSIPKLSEVPKIEIETKTEEVKEHKIQAESPKIKEKVVSEKAAEPEVALERKLRVPSNLTKTLNSSRSPFSFAPKKDEDENSE